MIKRVRSLPHCFCKILILFETGEVTVIADDNVLVDSDWVDLIEVAALIAHFLDGAKPIESVCAVVTDVLPPKMFGKLNFFLWQPFSVARCFSKSVNELGLESYLT